ncbi:MAG: hypothetical protein HQ517_05195 [SAR324 cluster bacterium]|nr:hypothetical protein [SAR324 cluster bacterium]
MNQARRTGLSLTDRINMGILSVSKRIFLGDDTFHGPIDVTSQIITASVPSKVLR